MKRMNIKNGPENVSPIILGCMRMPALSVNDAEVMIKTAGECREYIYKGDINELLKSVSEQDVIDLTITEPSLEDIFMNYYE